jgi:hypothetical protein
MQRGERETRLGPSETTAIERRKSRQMSYPMLRDAVRATLARLHAAVDAGDAAEALRAAADGLMRDARRRATSDRRLSGEQRAELAGLVEHLGRLRALLPPARAAA